jgi:hypothetical protein
LRRITRPDGSFERGEREPGVDRAADRIADHATRPGVEDRRQIDEAARDRDIGDVCVIAGVILPRSAV